MAVQTYLFIKPLLGGYNVLLVSMCDILAHTEVFDITTIKRMTIT